MSKKLSWSILVSFFTFDAVYSFYAVTKQGANEANWMIAPIVEKYPFLYFLCIPSLTVVMFILVELLVSGVTRLSLFKKVNRRKIERSTLGAIVIYWLVANSSLNIAYIFGFRGQGRVWYLTTIAGIFLGLIYFFLKVKSPRILDKKKA